MNENTKVIKASVITTKKCTHKLDNRDGPTIAGSRLKNNN